jgi:hypothetical protein
MTIKTNNIRRDIIRWWDLTTKEQKDFAHYLDTEERQSEAEFVRYRGVVYDLGDMERGCGGSQMPSEFKGWDNYLSDSFFSGILIRYANDFEQVICATYFS